MDRCMMLFAEHAEIGTQGLHSRVYLDGNINKSPADRTTPNRPHRIIWLDERLFKTFASAEENLWVSISERDDDICW
jgi:hypothetical protein